MLPLRKAIRDMAGYVPGFQPPDNEPWIKLNTNENPYPPSPHAVAAMRVEIGADGERLRLYPDPNADILKAAIAAHFARF